MLQRLLAIVDLFVSKTVTRKDLVIRARVFIGLLMTSILFVTLSSIHFSFTKEISFEQVQALVATVLMQCGFLVACRYAKDPEWPCLLYYLFVLIHVLVDTTLVIKSLFHPNIHILPLVLVFGFFSIVSPKKRFCLIVCTLSLSCAAVIYLMQNPSPVVFDNLPPADRGAISLSIFYRTLITICCIYWYVYLMRYAERELWEDTKLQVDSVKLGEISSSLETLIVEIEKPLLKLSEKVQPHVAVGTLPGEDEMMKMQADVKRMIEVTRSIGWVYRAYRHESIPATRSSHFRTQLEILVAGKLPAKHWRLKVLSTPDEYVLGGPLPILVLLIVTLTDHLRRSYPKGVGKDVQMQLDFDADTRAMSCEMLWPSQDLKAPHEFQKVDENPLNLSDERLRLELISELTQACEGRLETFQVDDMFRVKVSGFWTVSKV